MVQLSDMGYSDKKAITFQFNQYFKNSLNDITKDASMS